MVASDSYRKAKLESEAVEWQRDLRNEADLPEYRYLRFQVLVLRALAFIIKLLIVIVRDK